VNKEEPGQPASTAAVSGGPRSYQARIERIFDHARDVRSLFLQNPGQAMAPVVPGMFISIAIPLVEGRRLRAYTVASSPENPGPTEIVLNLVPDGAGSRWLFDRKVGDEVSFTGPYGTFTLTDPPGAELVFIAENTAIAPIRPMVRRALAGSALRSLEILYAADRPDHLLYQHEFEILAASHPSLQITSAVVSGGPEPLYAALQSESKRRWIDFVDNRGRHIYICGVGAGVIALRNLFRDAGYARRAVHYEKW
jgi:propane monooxygenase reductase subunit